MKFGYNPDGDIHDLTGKVFLITGGTAGVGREAVIQLAKHNPKHIYFTGRNALAASTITASLKSTSPNITFIPCDQSSLASVSQSAKTFLQRSTNELDVLICNAGIMAVPPAVSKDGYEIQFAVNHLAHALLIKLCLPALQKTAEEKGDARIVSLTSLGFKSASKAGIVFNDLKSNMSNLGMTAMTAKWYLYAQSKLANVLYAQQLSTRYPSITSTAIHPGLVADTSLIDHMGTLDRVVVKLASVRLQRITLQEGAYNTLWAATSKDGVVVSGGVYEPVGRPIEPTKQSADKGLEKELWEWTERELEAYS